MNNYDIMNKAKEAYPEEYYYQESLYREYLTGLYKEYEELLKVQDCFEKSLQECSIDDTRNIANLLDSIYKTHIKILKLKQELEI